jgi:hypothetical protein
VELPMLVGMPAIKPEDESPIPGGKVPETIDQV